MSTTHRTPPRVTKQSHTRHQVLDLIERLGVGTAIPSERQLSADLGVSRLTVRAALDDLAREGYLVRRRGMVPGSRMLSMETIHAGARLGRLLQVSPSEPILVIKRLRLADGEAMAIETLHIPSALVPGLTAKSLGGSFYELLEEQYGIVVASGTQAIEPTVTNEEESQALGVPLHSPAFLFERTSRDEEGRTVEFVLSVYRGDRYRIVTELNRPR